MVERFGQVFKRAARSDPWRSKGRSNHCEEERPDAGAFQDWTIGIQGSLIAALTIATNVVLIVLLDSVVHGEDRLALVVVEDFFFIQSFRRIGGPERDTNATGRIAPIVKPVQRATGLKIDYWPESHLKYASVASTNPTRQPHASTDTVIVLRFMVRAVGIEPTTHGLKNRCSPAELRPQTAFKRLSKNCTNLY